MVVLLRAAAYNSRSAYNCINHCIGLRIVVIYVRGSNGDRDSRQSDIHNTSLRHNRGMTAYAPSSTRNRSVCDRTNGGLEGVRKERLFTFPDLIQTTSTRVSTT